MRVLGKCGGFDADILAAMLWAQGNIPAAARVYRDAATIWPHDPEIRHWLAQAAAAAPPAP